jgi:hypothetical protein
MSESLRMWVEVAFNVCYLIVIWSLVFLMIRRKNLVSVVNQAVAQRVRWAFILLALGDSGHVGFRVIAYALGGLEAQPVINGTTISLVGLGALSTAITVTIFYMLVLDMWRLRFNKPLGWLGWFLLAAGVIRLIIMAFPQNQWQSVIAPYGWSLLRNAFLVIQGIGVLYLILRDAIRSKDKPFTWIGIMIATSFAFYAPVILWVAAVPLLGMLMIPKTCAYIVIALIAYQAMYRHQVMNVVKAAA